MKINKYRIKKAYQCYIGGIKQGRSIYWSFVLALDWFSSVRKFEGDTQ